METPEKITSHIKRLEWAVLFSQTDLADIREGDWLNVRQDLADFVFGAPDVSQELRRAIGGKGKRKGPDNLSREDVEKAQRLLREQLRRLVDNRFIVRFGKGSYQMMISPETGTPYVFVPSPASWDDRVFAALGFHLMTSKIQGGQIRKCRCGRVFLLKNKVRVDRQFHCSSRCAQSAATKAYRDRKKEELREPEAKRSKKRYRNKVLGK